MQKTNKQNTPYHVVVDITQCVFDWKLERLFSAVAFLRRGKFGTTFAIEDHSGYGASKEPMTVSWKSIDRFL